MATLKNLVDETTNIKNELKTCHSNLRANLTSKGISSSSSDKLLNLIAKIKNIDKVSSVIASDNFLSGAYTSNDFYTNSPNDFLIYEFYIGMNGSIRITSYVRSAGSGYPYANMYYALVRNGSVVSTSSVFSATNNETFCAYDFTGVKNGDRIKVYAKTLNFNMVTYVRSIELRGDII